MPKRLPPPRRTIALTGSNGYTLQINDIDNDTITAVIIGTTTGKRHANVTLTWTDLEELVDNAAAMMLGDDYGPDPYDTITPNPRYL